MAAGRGIAKDTATNVAAIAFSLVGGIANQSILAWYLGPVGRGEYGVWIAFAAIVAVLFTLGSDRAIQVFLISKRITVAQATCTAMLVGLVGSMTAMVVLWFGFQYDWKLLANVSQQNRILALLVVPAISLPLALQLLLAGLSHFATVAVINIVRAFLQVGLSAFFFMILGWEVKAAYTALVLSSGMTLIAYLLFLHWRYKLHKAIISSKVAAEVIGYSLRYFPARVGNVLNTNLILLILVFFASSREIGLFSLALVLIGQTLIISNALDRSVQPRLSAMSDGGSALIAQCCRISMLLYGVIMLVFLSIADFAVPMLFSNSFRDSIPLLWLLAPGAWLQGASKPLRTYFVGSNQPGVVSVSIMVETITALSSIVVFYPFSGIFGAALGIVLGQASGALVLAVAFHTYAKIGFTKTWIWNNVDTQCLKDYLVALFKIRLKPVDTGSNSNSGAVERGKANAPISAAGTSQEATTVIERLQLRRAQ